MSFRRDKERFRTFFSYLEETGLDEPIKEICRAHHTTLFEIYTDSAGATAHAARLETWGWLVLAIGKSASEVARMFDRDQASVLYGLRRLREVGGEQEVVLALDSVRPLARLVASKAKASRSAQGRRVGGPRSRPPTLPQDAVLGDAPSRDPSGGENAS